MKERILRNIAIAREGGYTIRPYVWLLANACCPLGACLVAEYGQVFADPATVGDLIANLLEISNEEVLAFAEGFDGQFPKPHFTSLGAIEAFDLGHEIRTICGFNT